MSFAQLLQVNQQLNQLKGELEHYASQFQALFHNLPLPLLLVDEQGAISKLNPAAFQVLGRAAADQANQALGALCVAADRAKVDDLVQRCLEAPDTIHTETVRLAQGDQKHRAYELIGQASAAPEDGTRILVYCRRSAGQQRALDLGANAPAPRPRAYPPQGTIPTDRLILGKDLEALPIRLNCTTHHCCMLIGVSPTTWAAWKRDPAAPVPNLPTVLAVRLLDAFPFLAEPAHSPEDLLALLRRTYRRRVSRIEVSLLLGRGWASFFRWTSRSAPAEVVQNLIGLLSRLLEHYPREVFDYYRSLVEAEARLRGIDNLWQSRDWRVGKAAREDDEEAD